MSLDKLFQVQIVYLTKKSYPKQQPKPSSFYLNRNSFREF
jgi:hypothetical protein